MIAPKKDVFNFVEPLVGPGSPLDEIEKRDEHIKKHSQEAAMGTQRKRNTASAETKLRELTRKSSQVLFQLRSVFPFDFFPDTITINANKIDIVQSEFFFSYQTTSVPLKNIANVEVDTSLFFSTLKLLNIRAPMRPISVSFLKNDEAVKAKEIIDGLLVATEQGADVSSLEPQKFLPNIEAVGKSFR